jgi:hypothetical protein
VPCLKVNRVPCLKVSTVVHASAEDCFSTIMEVGLLIDCTINRLH